MKAETLFGKYPTGLHLKTRSTRRQKSAEKVLFVRKEGSRSHATKSFTLEEDRLSVAEISAWYNNVEP